MLIYIITFIISCSLLKIANQINNKILKKTFNILAIIIPCILAGLRNTKVGTDVEVYVQQLFYFAKQSSSYNEFLTCKWWWIYRIKYVADFESAFTLFVYFTQKLTDNIQMVMFGIQVLISVPIYYVLKKIDKTKKNICFAMFIFYFSFFNVGLNTMRQYIAIAFIFYGTACLMYDKKNIGTIKFFLNLFIAYFFHNSSIFSILIYFIYTILNFNEKKEVFIKINNFRIRLKAVIVIGFTLVSIILILNANLFINMFSILGIKDYSGWTSGKITFMASKIIRGFPIIIALIISGKYYVKENKNSYMYIIMFVMSLAFAQFASASTYGERMSYIFQIFNIVLIPKLCNAHPNKNYNIIMKMFFVLYYIFYWYYYFAYGNSGETVPYSFFWQ